MYQERYPEGILIVSRKVIIHGCTYVIYFALTVEDIGFNLIVGLHMIGYVVLAHRKRFLLLTNRQIIDFTLIGNKVSCLHSGMTFDHVDWDFLDAL